MMKKITTIMTVLFMVTGMSFGDVWQDLAKYKYGGGNTADEAEQLLQKTPVAQHGGIEDSLIAVVSAKDATQDGKACACRMLQQIGTEKCIPAVANLLNDEVLSHYARLVLERMQNPKANVALLAALASAPDQAKPGIMGSLGVLRDANAVKPLTKLAVHSDPSVAAAAISALGKIGGESAAMTLYKLQTTESLNPTRIVAMLDCAQSLKQPSAMLLYEAVLASKTTHRIGALNGMLAVNDKKAVALMVNFIKGDDQQMAGGVLTLICGEKSDALTQSMAGLLATLPDDKKATLITALGARGDKAALGSIVGCMASTNDRVRNATLLALSKLGDDSTVKQMLSMSGGATDAIAKMPSTSVNDILVKALEDNKLKVPAIKALAARNTAGVVPALFKLVTDSDAEVRKAVWIGLGSLATEADIIPMTKLVFSIKDEGELIGAMATVQKVCSQSKEKAKCFDAVAAYYDHTTDAGKTAIIALASFVGSISALDIVKKALVSTNKELSSDAIRSLAAWCNESAADILLELAKATTKDNNRILALRGYIRIAGLEKVNLNATQKTEMLKKAAALATRPDEHKLIISNLQTVRHADAITMVSAYLDDQALNNDAEKSAVDMVRNFRKDESLAKVIKALGTKLIMTSKNKGIIDTATKALADIK